jgi:hypothetical protein
MLFTKSVMRKTVSSNRIGVCQPIFVFASALSVSVHLSFAPVVDMPYWQVRPLASGRLL